MGIIVRCSPRDATSVDQIQKLCSSPCENAIWVELVWTPVWLFEVQVKSGMGLGIGIQLGLTLNYTYIGNSFNQVRIGGCTQYHDKLPMWPTWGNFNHGEGGVVKISMRPSVRKMSAPLNYPNPLSIAL